MPGIFPQPDYAKAQEKLLAERNISVFKSQNLIKIDPSENTAIFTSTNGDIIEREYEMIHIVPPQGPLDVCKESGLGNAAGWIDVDKETLQHTRYPNIFSLGDCSSLPTSKTAAAIVAQNKIVSQNIADYTENKPLSGKYDGYSACPLVTSYDKVMLCEFDYELNKKETFWFNQEVPSKFAYKVKADIFPWIYWKYMLKGKWMGPT